jgi:hypothetical protein
MIGAEHREPLPRPGVGQVLLHVRPGYRKGEEPTLTDVTVASVGRKYFTLEAETGGYGILREKWHLSDGSNSDVNTKSYITTRAIYDRRHHRAEWINRLHEATRSYTWVDRLTNEQIRAILDVIEGPV